MKKIATVLIIVLLLGVGGWLARGWMTDRQLQQQVEPVQTRWAPNFGVYRQILD